MEGFHNNGGIELREEGRVEESLCLLGVGGRRLLEQHMFALRESLIRPLKVQTIRQGNVHCINGRVIKDGWRLWLATWDVVRSLKTYHRSRP